MMDIHKQRVFEGLSYVGDSVFASNERMKSYAIDSKIAFKEAIKKIDYYFKNDEC